jgi:hypothetical protein
MWSAITSPGFFAIRAGAPYFLAGALRSGLFPARAGRIKDMQERERNSSGVGCFTLGMAALMLLPMYVLSIGPVAWLAERFPSLEPIGIIYAPMAFLAEVGQPFNDAMSWYIELWIN